MYNKLSFSQWLTRFKNFNSMKHFNNYIDSLTTDNGEHMYAYEYYKNQYDTWCLSNFGEIL